jgi:hypothetical protein
LVSRVYAARRRVADDGSQTTDREEARGGRARRNQWAALAAMPASWLLAQLFTVEQRLMDAAFIAVETRY